MSRAVNASRCFYETVRLLCSGETMHYLSMTTVADRVRQAIEVMKITTNEMDRRLEKGARGYTSRFIRQNQDPRGESLNDLAKALDVDLSWLLRGEGRGPKPPDVEIVKRIKLRLEALSITPTKLDAELKAQRGYTGQVLKGERNPSENLGKIAEVLGVDEVWLRHGDAQPEPAIDDYPGRMIVRQRPWYKDEPEPVRKAFESLTYQDGDKKSAQNWSDTFFNVRSKYERWVLAGSPGRFSVAFGEERPSDFEPRQEKISKRRDRSS